MEPSSPPASSMEPNASETSVTIPLEASNPQSESSLQVSAALRQILPNSAFQRLVSTIRSGQSVLNSASSPSNPSRAQSNATSSAEFRRRASIVDSDSVSSSSDIESGSSTEAASAAPAPQQTPEEVAAAAAEARQQLQNAIALQNALKSLLRYLAFNLPYYAIFFGLVVYLYMPTIGMLLLNFAHFLTFNDTIKKQVALKENRRISPLLNVFCWALVHIAATQLVFPTTGLLVDALLFRIIPEMTFSNALWMIIFNDMLLKLIATVVKCVVVIVVGHKPPFDARGRLYAMIDLIFYDVRQCVPIPVWLSFFASLPTVPCWLFGSLYTAAKVWRSYQRLRLSLPFMKAFFLGRSPFGRYATEEMVQAANSESCSVCQDGFTRPVALQCGHIFCESCIATWFEREATCPLCRASVSHAGTPTHSDGGTSLMIEMF
eukprot:TRINITY_DN7941_c0_g1_i1.p1 TRINITY_DN7941_c0_g1~~TRINITY_DN7941_c0_g1_i1.p1  ORF type:complete len:434 (-),score=54.41 TRINITY_DN7941_c0_g1_i1:1486-2787(-)